MKKISPKKLITLTTLTFVLFGFFSSSIYARAYSESGGVGCASQQDACAVSPERMTHSSQHTLMPCCFDQGSHFYGTISNNITGKIMLGNSHNFSSEAIANENNVFAIVASSSPPPSAEVLASVMKKE